MVAMGDMVAIIPCSQYKPLILTAHYSVQLLHALCVTFGCVVFINTAKCTHLDCNIDFLLNIQLISLKCISKGVSGTFQCRHHDYDI